MSIQFSNFGKALVSSAPSGLTGLSFTVETGKGALFPNLGTGDYFYGIFKDASGNREIVKIEGRSGDSMTIAASGRGLDGTTARSWAAGDYFVAGLTNIALVETLANKNISAIGNLVFTADTFPYFTGPEQVTLTTLTPFARTLLDDADAATMRNTLGAAGQAFPAGTNMIFFQKSAPIGWTNNTTGLDHALRLVPGGGVGGTTGGSLYFSAAFKSQSVAGTVGATTLSEAQIPAHFHNFAIYPTSGSGSVPSAGTSVGAFVMNTTGYKGGGGSHTHSFSGTPINLTVAYVNVILASKD